MKSASPAAHFGAHEAGGAAATATPSARDGLRIDGLRVRYRGSPQPVLDGLGFELPPGRIAALLGPSGCGKSTLLRAIAGFELPESGRIELGSITLSGPGTHRPPEQRNVGMMFQEYALFPHLTVAENVRFGLRRWPRPDQLRRCDEILALVGLPDMGSRYPHELSGGQQQRVALARALAPSPMLLLLDEPYASVDIDARERLASTVRGILKESNQMAMLVTHHPAEAHAMADIAGTLHAGRQIRWETTSD